MGLGFSKRLMIIGLCLGLASVLIYGRPAPRVVEKDQRLDKAFASVGPWSTLEVLGFDERIVDALQLDDYTHRTYSNGEEVVWVYVGYYLTDCSIGAAHSPLVCYPGQGWLISDTQGMVLDIDDHQLHLMSLVVTKRGREDLVLYWFQAYDRSSAGTFLQKIHAMWAKVTTGNQESAFVRISVPVMEGNRDEARAVANTFVRDFYPVFLDYVTQDSRHQSGVSNGSS